MGKRTNTAVWLENQNRWQIKVQKDGVRRTFTSAKPGRTGQRECNAKADAWLDDNIDGGAKVKVLYAKWIGELKQTTSKSHWGQYEWIGGCYFLPRLGEKKLSSLNEQVLQNVILDAYAAGLSFKSLKTAKSCITAFMKYARKNNASTLFPESLYIPKDAPKAERQVLQPDDVYKLFTCDTTLYRGKPKPAQFIYAWRFAVVTGLRPGELLGLMWKDVHGSTVSVARSWNARGEITTRSALLSYSISRKPFWRSNGRCSMRLVFNPISFSPTSMATGQLRNLSATAGMRMQNITK